MARILLVEDDRDIGDLMQVLLSSAEHDVVWVRDGGTALSALAAQVIDLVIADVRLPGEIDGLELVRHLRSTVGTGPRVLLMSAEPGSVADRARSAGADDFLDKPFEVADLLRRVVALASPRLP